jgi:molybdopterin synthase catalytic subunit
VVEATYASAKSVAIMIIHRVGSLKADERTFLRVHAVSSSPLSFGDRFDRLKTETNVPGFNTYLRANSVCALPRRQSV